MARDRKNRLQIAFGVVESVEQMNSAGTGGGAADPKAARVFGIAAGGESSRLFMAYLNEAKFFLMSAEGFEESVYAVSSGLKPYSQ